MAKNEVLISIGTDYVKGLGSIQRTVPFFKATEYQLKTGTRLVFHKGQLVKTVTPADLRNFDTSVLRGDWRK